MSKFCIIDEAKECTNCGECSVCDLDPTKICDNCEKCLWDKDKKYNDVLIDDIVTIEQDIDDDEKCGCGHDHSEMHDEEHELDMEDMGETIEKGFWEKEDEYWEELEDQEKNKHSVHHEHEHNDCHCGHDHK